MAKTKAGPGRQINRLRLNNNNNNNKKHMQNGLYVHSSPPKALNDDTGPATAKIREYIRAADVEALENVVLLGQGTKLINQHATDQRVRNFLKTVPSYMSKIDLVHDSVEKGNLRDLKALLDRRKLARSKDAQGVGLLHKAVVHGHRDIVDYLITDYPETLEVTDNKSLTVEALGRLLETVPELPEDQTPEPLTPSCTPSPTPDAEPSHTPKTRAATRQEAWVERDAARGVVSLEAGSGLELELADWSTGDATGCYPSLASPSGQQQEQDSLVFSPALARSITYLLSRGRSGRLPRLPPPSDSPPLGDEHPHPGDEHQPPGDEHPPHGAAQLAPILRLTNHAQCVDSDAQLPPTTNRGRRAYLKHVQRMAGCRPLGPEGTPLASPSALLTPHIRLPDIPRRPRRESPHPVLPRPLTPTPITLPKAHWRRAVNDAAIVARLEASLRNIRGSDSDEGEGGNDPATPATPRPHSSTHDHNPRPITYPPPSDSPSPTPTEVETPTPVLMPTLITLDRDPGVTRAEATRIQHREPTTADPHSPHRGQPTKSLTSIRDDEDLRVSLSSSGHVELEITQGSHPGPSPVLGVEQDLQVRSYSKASPTMQKYVRWLSSRVLGQGFADLKGIYFRRITRHQERLNVWEIVYEHDVTYWARVIVDRVLESVINFLLELEEEGRESAIGQEPLVDQRNVSGSDRGTPKRGRSSRRSRNRSRASKETPGDSDPWGEPESQSTADARLQSTADSPNGSEAFQMASSEVESHTDFPAEEGIPHETLVFRGQSSTKPGRRDFPPDGSPVRTQESELRTTRNPRRRSSNSSGRRSSTRTPSELAVDWQTQGQLTPTLQTYFGRRSTSATPSDGQVSSGNEPAKTRTLENVKTMGTPSPVQGDYTPSLTAKKLTSSMQAASAQGHSAAPEHNTQGASPQQSPHSTNEHKERTEDNITKTLGAGYPEGAVSQANPRPDSALLKLGRNYPFRSKRCSMAGSGHGSLHNSTSGPHSGAHDRDTPPDISQTSDPPMALGDPGSPVYTQPKDLAVGEDPTGQPQPRCASSQVKTSNRMDDSRSCSSRSVWDFVEESPSLTSYELHRLFRSPALSVGRPRRWTPRSPSPTMGELRALIQREEGLATVDEATSMLATEGSGDGGACGGRPADETSLRTDAEL
ncbi:uncharacterized protein [Panulirus ornatus]|uniref:uncharacterized protein isoform X5 n=1 Tax=Panulirus ornatus TaxID=150431 RepID=UPI003A8AE05A